MHKPGGEESNAEETCECTRGTGWNNRVKHSTPTAWETEPLPGAETLASRSKCPSTCQGDTIVPTAQIATKFRGSGRVTQQRPSFPLAFIGPNPFCASSVLGHKPTRLILGSAPRGKPLPAECQLVCVVLFYRQASG